jgi:iron complex outermembrane receptor protein
MPTDDLQRPVSANEAAIAGLVTDEAGRPLPWAVISFAGSSPEHRDIGAVTDEQGRYRFDRLTPGLYTVTVNAEAYPHQEKQVKASAGRLARLDFALRR